MAAVVLPTESIYMCMYQYILRKRNFGVICGDSRFIGWHITIMSKVLKIHTIPKSLNTMGSVENQHETFCDDLLKIDAFKDWLEPVPEDQYKALCSVCNVTLDCSRSELSKHAVCSGHQAALQNSRKRKAVIGQLIGKVNMASSSGGAGQPRKIILLRRNMKPSIQCEVREAVSEDSEGDISTKVLTTTPTLKKVMHFNDMQMVQQRKRKSFRLEWLDVPEFKDWLSPDPDSPYKARCLACNTVLNAGKSELEKHAAGAKHEKAVEVLKRMVLQQQEWDEAAEMDEEEDNEDEDYETRVCTATQTSGDEMLEIRREEQNQQLEVLHRIAASVESLAASTAGALESLAKTQETLSNILMHLVNK
ncbi:uncharacterized protein [Periplaneta americana]|uniref:uncharacterized protein isoform X2 n=1 Tax=Periplaneta americana TaxID=6978 RepID=UPI0037E992B7